MTHWHELLNVQNVEKGFFASSNSYGIPDIKRDEFEVKTLIPYRVDSNSKGTLETKERKYGKYSLS